MPNSGVAIELEPADRMQLESWQSSHGTPQQVALRCRIVLAALAGEDNVSIAEELCVSRPTVQLWRRRVALKQLVGEQGIGAVWQIAAGRGRKPRYDQAQRAAIIEALIEIERFSI